MTRKAERDRPTPATVLGLTAAADELPMGHGAAVKWLREHELVHDLDGRQVVIWGDVLEALRGNGPPTAAQTARDRWATVGRSPLR